MKDLPLPIILVTVYNVIEIIVMTYILTNSPFEGWLFALTVVECIFVLTANYFLLKKNPLAWKALLIWFIIITFSFEIPLFAWDLAFGAHVSTNWGITLGSIEFKFGLDMVSLVMLIIHYRGKRHFNQPEEPEMSTSLE